MIEVQIPKEKRASGVAVVVSLVSIVLISLVVGKAIKQ
jgi:hypothetical protein